MEERHQRWRDAVMTLQAGLLAHGVNRNPPPKIEIDPMTLRIALAPLNAFRMRFKVAQTMYEADEISGWSPTVRNFNELSREEKKKWIAIADKIIKNLLEY